MQNAIASRNYSQTATEERFRRIVDKQTGAQPFRAGVPEFSRNHQETLDGEFVAPQEACAPIIDTRESAFLRLPTEKKMYDVLWVDSRSTAYVLIGHHGASCAIYAHSPEANSQPDGSFDDLMRS